MMGAVKLASLFLAYGFIGFGGDYVVGLLAQDQHADAHHFVVDVERVVDVEVDVAHVHDVHVQHSGECEFEVERRVTLDASATEWLRLEAGAGSLAVEGQAGLGQVQAVGRACASDASYLDDLRLTLERVNDEIVLSAHYPDRSGRGNSYARIDLAVEIPLNMAVDLDDSSGSMEVAGTGELRIDDSSGSILVHGVNGPVFIDDSSGEIELSDVAGDVQIEDGSGEIDVRDVQGSVHVRDGSGSIDIVEVEQSVIVEGDGSGSIEVRDVGGDFSVLSDGSGSIRHSGVGGAVDIPQKKRERRRGN